MVLHGVTLSGLTSQHEASTNCQNLSSSNNYPNSDLGRELADLDLNGIGDIFRMEVGGK